MYKKKKRRGKKTINATNDLKEAAKKIHGQQKNAR